MKYVHGEQESYWNDVGVVLVNFLLTINIFHNFFLVFLLLTLNKYMFVLTLKHSSLTPYSILKRIFYDNMKNARSSFLIFIEFIPKRLGSAQNQQIPVQS